MKRILDLCKESRYAVAYGSLNKYHIRMNEIYDLAKEVERDLTWLRCLEDAGVDNWQGCDYASELMKEKYNDGW